MFSDLQKLDTLKMDPVVKRYTVGSMSTKKQRHHEPNEDLLFKNGSADLSIKKQLSHTMQLSNKLANTP